MAGSRKGEKRGGANPNRIKTGPSVQFSPRAAVLKKAKGKTASFKDDPVLANIARSELNGMNKPQQIQLFQIASGKNITLPREVMLDAMRYFQETAIEYYEVMRANMERAASARTPEQREIYENAVLAAEGRLERYLVLSADIGARCAPFMHPRLAAIVTNAGGTGNNPVTVLQMLMQDIDEAGRPPRFIDNEPDEGKL